MRKNKIQLIVLLSLIIFSGLLVIGILNFSEASSVIRDNIQNITELTSMSIYSEINVELSEPIFVSQTMANDQFLKDWIGSGEQDIGRIKAYLLAIREKYGYDSVFLVSNGTDKYYHYNGVLKQMSLQDPHDEWFYDFLDHDAAYVLDIDTDEAAGSTLTLFINSRITGDNGASLGVTGVGVEIARLSQIMRVYNQKQGVDVYLVDGQGNVQISADETDINQYNMFDDPVIVPLRTEIVFEKTRMQVFEYDIGGKDEYLVTRYFDDLGWYLIVKKDTSVLQEMLQGQMAGEFAVFAVVLAVVLLISIKIISNYQKKINVMAASDMLTGLHNRRVFDEVLREASEAAGKGGAHFTLAIFDIDDFKAINDTYGHVSGDAVLRAVGETTAKMVRKGDMLARWGGDEFAIIFRCSADEAQTIIERIRSAYRQNADIAEYGVTVSFGLTEYAAADSVDSILRRADDALYAAKRKGRDQVCKK